MPSLQRLHDGEVVTEDLIENHADAVIAYCRATLLTQVTGGHIRLVEQPSLPGLPPKIIAEWFGDGSPESALRVIQQLSQVVTGEERDQ